MNPADGIASHKIGIVGGGVGGASLLRFLLEHTEARLEFVVDRDPAAPGMRLAAERGIATFTDLAGALAKAPCTLVFEMTGVPAVQARLAELVQGRDTQIMPSATWLLLREMENVLKRSEQQVVQEIHAIRDRLGRDLEGGRNLVDQINHIMSSMQMLSLNASIEAAKVGVHGRGFAVVADHMTRSVESVRSLTHKIVAVNEGIQEVSEQIDRAIVRLT